MIEVIPNLFVGSETDERRLSGQAGWFFIHACKEPYHSRALGYAPGKSAPKGAEYFYAWREGQLILNLIDAPNPNFIPVEIIDVAIETIHKNISHSKILLHCNQGQSRSPSIALLYLLKHTDILAQKNIVAAIAAFQAIYPPYAPARGMAEYVRLNWNRYAQADSL
ncbi:dual specificity protein phosphatase family protein [Acidiphilium sp. C61]|uniref:dual specificity protein phosphatase family protein n=1 Tax=Acidiphilium sp. C61 TaxID=1671485 RepID=UPI00157A22C4|nr:dual specificity protein phosphatase family protein [Acidiphilium sp. C61]